MTPDEILWEQAQAGAPVAHVRAWHLHLREEERRERALRSQR